MGYLIPEPQNDHEEAVQDVGYPWVSTVNLGPHGSKDLHVLKSHVHNSHNTHLIVKGQLTLYFDDGQTTTLDANSRNPRQKEWKVAPGVWYDGVAGPNGAVFVEGHSILSPDTADRFWDRGHLEWEEVDGEDYDEWFQAHKSEEWAQLGPNPRFRRVDLRGLY